VKELYRDDLPLWLRVLGVWRINSGSIDFNWGYFAPRFGFEMLVSRGGYFDQRYAITLCLIWGVIHINLPFKTRIPESCDTPIYGIQIHSNTFWIHLGGKMNDWEQCDSDWITWDLPYFSWHFNFYKVWNGSEWVLASKDYSEPYADKREIQTHPYRYTLHSGEVQERTASVNLDRRQWHRKWLPFLKKTSTSININFSDEVGEETGSWKGGCIGCGWDIKPNESMLDALQRMEAERSF